MAGRRAGEADVLAEVEGDAAVVAAARAGADPDQLAAGAELVEPGRRVGAEPARQHVALPDLRGQRDALQRHQRLAQAVGAGAGGAVGVDVLPARQEAGEAVAVGGLDLAAQVGEAGAAHPAQDVGVAPLALGAARQQLAADQRPFALQLAQRRGRVDAVAGGELRGREGAVGAGVAADQGAHRVGVVLEEGLRQAGRRRHAERVAVEAGVLGGDVALLAADPDQGDAALGDQLLQHRGGRVALGDPLGALLRGQVAEVAQQLLQGVAVAGAARPRCGAGAAPRPPPAPRGRSARAAPPGRAARAAGRGRGPAPRRGARRSACPPRTCRWRRSRRAARRRRARRSASRPRPG